MDKIDLHCSSNYLSEVSIVMNCNHILHPGDLLSESEEVAPKEITLDRKDHMVLETQPWSLQPTLCTYLVTQKHLLEICSGSLVKTAVVINPLYNVCRNSEFYFI